jgi:hypothetical protein
MKGHVAPDAFVRGCARSAQWKCSRGSYMPELLGLLHASLRDAGRTNASAPTQMWRTDE